MIKTLVVLLSLTVSSVAQIRFHPVEKDTVLHRLEAAPLKNESRQQILFDMFATVGCKAELQPLKHSKFSNVICVLPGASEDAIIVGGHFDKVDQGKGIVDDWSGASLLPTLYESLKRLPRRHTLIFVAFAEEEKGLVGSISYVKQMSPDARSHAKEMINLECLGMNQTEVWASHSDARLLNALAAVSQAMKIDVKGVNVEKVGTADSESFAAIKIPRTTIHSVDQNTLAVLHSNRDDMKAIHSDQYYESYRLIAGYLSAVDEWFDRPEGEKKEASMPESPTSRDSK